MLAFYRYTGLDGVPRPEYLESGSAPDGTGHDGRYFWNGYLYVLDSDAPVLKEQPFEWVGPPACEDVRSKGEWLKRRDEIRESLRDIEDRCRVSAHYVRKVREDRRDSMVRVAARFDMTEAQARELVRDMYG